MKNISIALLSMISLFISSKTYAWGRKGHALVAEIAWNHMDEATRKNVLLYLDGVSIEEAANWMDAQRGDHNYDFMKSYHYVNVEKGGTVGEQSGDNIIKTLNTTLGELNHINALSNKEVQVRLFYLFHLIGDLHMPLHVGYGTDKGGNSVLVSFLGKDSNLHSVWDTDIIEYKKLKLEEAMKAGNFTTSELTEIEKINVITRSTTSKKAESTRPTSARITQQSKSK